MSYKINLIYIGMEISFGTTISFHFKFYFTSGIHGLLIAHIKFYGSFKRNPILFTWIKSNAIFQNILQILYQYELNIVRYQQVIDMNIRHEYNKVE